MPPAGTAGPDLGFSPAPYPEVHQVPRVIRLLVDDHPRGIRQAQPGVPVRPGRHSGTPARHPPHRP